MGPQPSKHGGLLPLPPVASPQSHVRSRDTLYVVSRVLETQAEDSRRKDVELGELRAEFSRLQEAQIRLAELTRDTERRLDSERKENIKLRKDMARKDEMITRVTGGAVRVNTSGVIGSGDVTYLQALGPQPSGSPVLSIDSSLGSETLLDETPEDSDGESDGAEHYDAVLNETIDEINVLVEHLKTQMAKLRSLWEEIWSTREENGEDPNEPNYCDDLTTVEKRLQAEQLQRQIGTLNRQLIILKYSQRMEMMKAELQTPHKQQLLRRVTSESRVNFDSPHARSIQVHLTGFVTRLLQRLVHDDKRFVGKLVGVGSYHDSTKLGDPDEMDFIYVLLHPRLAKSRVRHVGPDTYEVVPTVGTHTTADDDWAELLHDDKLEVYVPFTRKVEGLLTQVPLPPGITFGGIDAPKASGIRKNRPAVTIYFQCRGRPVYVDITAALIAPHNISSEVIARLPMHVKRRVEHSVTPTSRKLGSISEMILLVQAGGFGEWKATTTALEVHLLQSMRFNSQILKLITLLKYINDKVLSIHPVDITEYLQVRGRYALGELVNALFDQNLLPLMNKLWRRQDHESLVLFYLALRDMTGADTIYRKKVQVEWKEKLLARPSSIQSYIHPSLQRLAGEKPLSLVSSSSCIFKYLVIGLYVRGKLQFMAEDAYHIQTSLVTEILRDYKKSIKQKDDYNCDCGSVQHPFLRFDIPVRSVRNHTVESLSGVHELSCHSLRSLHCWMTRRCERMVRDQLTNKEPTEAIYDTTQGQQNQGVYNSNADEHTYEEIPYESGLYCAKM